MARIAVCGGRHFANRRWLFDVLNTFHAGTFGPIEVLLHGAAPGADRLAQQWARRHRVPDVPYVAQEAQYGASAEPMRNRRVIMARPDFVIAFPVDPCAADLVTKARAAGIPAFYVSLDHNPSGLGGWWHGGEEPQRRAI